MFIDSHCHLDAAEFGNTQASVVHDAVTAGVSRMVVPSVARTNFDAVRMLCEQCTNCAPAYGIHPMYTNDAAPASPSNHPSRPHTPAKLPNNA